MSVICCLLLLLAALPLAAQPNLMLGEEDFARINALSERETWAANARAAILRSADAWPKAYLDRFGLKELAIPTDGGQWSHHYVCPTHGVRLQFTAPATHRCPIDGRTFTGWPYDQVIVADRHDSIGDYARDLGLAFRLTGNRDYAEKAAWILREYARIYPSFPLHDVNNRQTRSAGRLTAQTLNEAIWLQTIAWAYDLIRDAGVLTPEDRALIDRDLIRALAGTVLNNDAGKSNWQSWHNAGLLAAGLLLDDSELIDRAIDGRSGFRSQMKESVVDGGFWYEGAWGYHFYALDALVRTAEMARRRQIDLWASEPALATMFTTPLRLMFPDGALPLFNDTGPVNLFTQDSLYEIAHARTGDPALLSVLGRRARGRHALLWGAESLDAAAPPPLRSEVFREAGFAALRNPVNDHTWMMKFGPHGGGHGHYDKLGVVSYFNGGILGVDPGTQPYAAPSHKTWDLMTVAHNTIVVDEKRQNEATGELLWFQEGEGFSAAAASAGPAYPDVAMTRTLFVTPDYAIDLCEAQSTAGRTHQFDWVYHNGGTLRAGLPLEPWTGFGKANGYQHLTETRAARTADSWRANFDGSPATLPTAGPVYASNSNVKAAFTLSREQSFAGAYSARAQYEFAGPGYALYTVNLSGAPAGKPSGLRLQVYGDGSGHRLSLRLSDASDERFVATVGPVDWTGWKLVEVRDPESWTHFLGNNDGVFDGPARAVIVQIDYAAGGPAQGALFVDDPVLLMADGEFAVPGLELTARHLTVQMLGHPDTDVVTGLGLGPDLRVPVPFVLARRTGESARFVTLFTPHTTEPTAGEATLHLASEPEGCLTVRSPQWRDIVCLSPAGVTYRRE